jgi:iron complex outermembrane recepter protein
MMALTLPAQPPGFSTLPARDLTAELKKLSLDELLELDVTTVGRREQRLAAVPAAAVVITNDEIRRSGARSIPEALRLAPNLHVAQIDSRQWAVSARGFNGTVANKLLVMIDGRSVYTPLFSGVFWDVQDVLLEDIDRIEVISGPGGTLWGANAVNGVVNIITRHARDSQGTFLSGGGGNFERGLGEMRHGGQLSETAYYRVYAKYFNRDSTRLPGGARRTDAWHMGQGGFRVDWDASELDAVTFQGDVYGGDIEQAFQRDIRVSGGNLLAKWSHRFSLDSAGQLQAYFDRARRDIPSTFGQSLHTYDVDWQHHFRAGDRHHFLWGAGYRLMDDSVRNTQALAFLPADVRQHLFTAFIQDEIALVHDRLALTLGSKFEHNDYSAFEFQPGARLGWHVAPRHFVWTAVSRAVRTPSRIDRDFFIPGEPPFRIAGGPNFTSERLLAYEVGYRAQVHDKFSLTATTFYHDYDRLRSLEPGPPQQIDNGLEGESYGIELDGIWQAAEWWRWRVGYAHVQKKIWLKDWSRDVNQGRAENVYPENQFFLRSALDLPRNVEFDAGFRMIDRLEHFSGGQIETVPGYAELDLRLGWHPARNLELAVVGRNVLHGQRPEFGFPTDRRAEIPRSVYGRMTWRS